MVTGLRGLRSRLLEVREYLEAVLEGRLPLNHDIMRNLQASAEGELLCLLAGRRGGSERSQVRLSTGDDANFCSYALPCALSS